MSKTIKRIEEFAERVLAQASKAQTEEATKLAMINPFIREMLDYNTADLNQCLPEYIADIGGKKGEKVDYVLMQNDEPIILIEAKKAGFNLSRGNPTQLKRYFSTLPNVHFAIFTNGVEYHFYTDADGDSLMDDDPFIILDLNNINEAAVNSIEMFIRNNFSEKEAKEKAFQMKCITDVSNYVLSNIVEPSDEFVKFIATEVYPKRNTKKALGQFKEYTTLALDDLKFNGKLLLG